MRKLSCLLTEVVAGLALAMVCASASAAGVRIKDLTLVSGARDNQLVGYGLVVGLAGDGDKDPVYTKQAVANLLQRNGINVPAQTLSSKNVAVANRRLRRGVIPTAVKTSAGNHVSSDPVSTKA